MNLDNYNVKELKKLKKEVEDEILARKNTSISLDYFSRYNYMYLFTYKTTDDNDIKGLTIIKLSKDDVKKAKVKVFSTQYLEYSINYTYKDVIIRYYYHDIAGYDSESLLVIKSPNTATYIVFRSLDLIKDKVKGLKDICDYESKTILSHKQDLKTYTKKLNFLENFIKLEEQNNV